MIESLLGGLAVNFLTAVTKGTVKGLKKLFTGDELKTLLNQAYSDFKESYTKEGSNKEEKILVQVFEDFFMDKRIIYEFQLVLQGKAGQVDFDVLHEIFVSNCMDRGIETPDFNFYQAMSSVIKEIEALAQREEKFRESFKVANLGGIYQQLQKRGMEPNFTFARQKYLRQLMIHNQRLQFTGIPDLKEKKDITIPSVFVMQRAKENVDVKDYERSMLEKEHDENYQKLLRGVQGDAFLEKRPPGRRRQEKEPIKFDRALKESDIQRFVVLGKPGSGKSTLLKYLMLVAVQEQLENHRVGEGILFPILVEIRKFEYALSKTTKADYNILDYLYDSMRRFYNLTLPGGFFEKYLDSGRALLLFDGLDEVAAEARRAEVRQMISAFVTGHHSKNTVIVTSRIAGYDRVQFSSTDYRHFTLEDFNEEETGEFIRKWYRSRLTNPAEAETKASDLVQAIARKPRIKELAKNPLLLTIVAIIHRYEAQLPEDRLILYDKATEALLYTWDNVKDIIDEKFKPDDKRRFLEKVAFHLQSLERGDEAGTVIDRHEVYKILFPDFCRVFQVDKWQAKGLVDEFLDKIRTRAGLLVEQAPDQYGFVHKTFQEYFAAKWIANEALLNFDLQIMINYVEQFIDNAFWQETLLLALRALPHTQTLKVLEYILNRDPKGIEQYFFHNHYFVMKFIAEQGKWLDRRDFVEKLVIDFFDFSWNESIGRDVDDMKTWNRFNKWLSTITNSLVKLTLSSRLLSTVEDEKQSDYLRVSCAEAVEKLGLKDRVVEILLRLAEDEKQEYNLRCFCAEAVGNLGLKDQAVVGRLLRLAEDEKQAGHLRLSCAHAVENLGFKDQAVEILLQLAEDEKQEGDLRLFCAEAVGKLGLKDQAVEILLQLAEDEKQASHLQLSCAYTVGNLGFKDQAVVGRLLRLAEDEKQEGDLRSFCAAAVGNLGRKDQAVVGRLLRLAEDEKQEGYLRRSCADAVGNLGRKDQAVVGRLLRLAEDEKQEGYLRLSSASAVGNLGLKNQAIEILLSLAGDEKQKDYHRYYSAYAIGILGEKNKAVDILIGLYLAHSDKYKIEANFIHDSLWDLTEI